MALKWIRCGKPNCRCARGRLHGPYLYRSRRRRERVATDYSGRPDPDRALLHRLRAWGREQASQPIGGCAPEEALLAVDESLALAPAYRPPGFETALRVRRRLQADGAP